MQKGVKDQFADIAAAGSATDNKGLVKPQIRKPFEKVLPMGEEWEEEKFEREADLWGLSEEDRRIAKEERMTPAEFIEAEEYDDDELLKDEWER